jgi:hypothetical protein
MPQPGPGQQAVNGSTLPAESLPLFRPRQDTHPSLAADHLVIDRLGGQALERCVDTGIIVQDDEVAVAFLGRSATTGSASRAADESCQCVCRGREC